MDSDRFVALVTDSAWPDRPAVCCWRDGIRAAFATTGVAVRQISVQPESGADRGARPGRARRLGWLPDPLRRPLVAGYRFARRLTGMAAAGRAARSVRVDRDRIAATIGPASVIIAESPGVARAIVSARVPARRVWVLALPEAWPAPSAATAGREDGGYHHDLAALASIVGGFLVGTEAAREAVERVAAACRPQVRVLPLLAMDRPCSGCGGSAGADPAGVDSAGVDLAEDSSVDPWARPWLETLPAAKTGAGPDGIAGRIPAGANPGWTADRQAQRAATLLAAADPTCPDPTCSDPTGAGQGRPGRSVVVSGFDLKFVRELATRLDQRPGLSVSLDEWPALSQPSARTADLVGRAETVVAEWARPSAVWLSRRKRPGQFLVVRLHRYELDCPYPKDIEIERVDAVVHVSPPVGRRIRAELGWPAEKLVYLPNFVDLDWLDRPKLPEARFGLGVVGIEWANKRFDLALDILAEVRRSDPRFTLFVRSVAPWDNRYAWARADERGYVAACLARIERDPLLRGGVVFDPPGRDMARWYRKVGQILSLSDIESFHLAAAEGMASGAVPVIRPWPGAAEIYDPEWICAATSDAVSTVLANADLATWAGRADRARAEIRRKADPGEVVAAWADLLRGDLDGARRRFGPA